MELIPALLLFMWLYGVCMLIYVPGKILRMRYESRDIWAFLSRGRLLCSVIAYAASAPLPVLLTIMIGAGGVSGSSARGVSQSIEWLAWTALWIFLGAAAVALMLVFFRPHSATSEERAAMVDQAN